MGCAGSKNPFGGVLVSLTTKQVPSKSPRQQVTTAPTPDIPIYVPSLQQGWGAYQGAPRLSSDAERVEELSNLPVHPTQAEPRFDRITKVVAELFDMPVAAITLIDNLSCYIKSHNPGKDFRGDEPTDRRLAFGSWTQVPLNPEVLVLEDTTLDARSRESPWVLGAPHIRFYVGAPLIANDGSRIGTLHVADFKPRKFGASACTILCNFAELAARELSAPPASTIQPMTEAVTRAQQQRARVLGADHRLHPIVPCVAAGVVLVDVAQPKWPILFCDSLWAHHTGAGEDALIGKPFWDAYSIPGVSSKEAAPWDAFARAIRAHEMFCVGVVDVTHAEHVERRFGVTFKPASRDNVDAVTWQIRISNHRFGTTDTHEQDLNRYWFATVTSEAADATSSTLQRTQQAEQAADATSSIPQRAQQAEQAEQAADATSSNPQRAQQAEQAQQGFPASGAAPESITAHAASQAGGKGPAQNGDDAGPSGVGFDRGSEGPRWHAEPAGVADPAAALYSATRPCGLDPQMVGSCPFEDVSIGPLLGRGSFGCVFVGNWNGAPCAVKVMEHKLSDQGIKEADAALEGMLGLKLSHPNIVRTYKYKVVPRAIPMWKRLRNPELWAAEAAEAASSQWLGDDATPSTSQGDSSPPMKTARLWQGTGELARSQWCIETWLVMELCGLGDLQELIDQGIFRNQNSSYAGGVNMLWIVLTAAEIAAAMAYLHSQDILHGDLSGGNVLLVGNSGADDRPFAAKVADFGLSRILAGDDTVETVSFGTVTHMPPELLREGRLSKAADVYAYGVILWSMYTGQRPWAGMRHAQIIAQKFLGKASLPFPDHTPRAYRELAEGCMAPNDAARPSFADVVAALKPVHAAARSGKLTNADFDFPVYPAYKDEGRPALIVKQEEATRARADQVHKASKGSGHRGVVEE